MIILTLTPTMTNIETIYAKRDQFLIAWTGKTIEAAIQDHLSCFILNKVEYIQVSDQVKDRTQ